MADNRLLQWLKLMLILLLLPLLVVVSGWYYVFSLNKTLNLRAFELDAGELLDRIKQVADTEKYICNALTDTFNNSADVVALKAAVEKFDVAHDLKMKFLIWKPDGDVFYSNFDHLAHGGDWSAAFLSLKRVKSRYYGNGETDIPPDVYANLRIIYGTHFFPRYFNRSYSGKNVSLRRGSVSPDKPLVWLNVKSEFGLSVFLSSEVLLSDCGLKNLLTVTSGEFIAGYIKNGVLTSSDSEFSRHFQNQTEMLRCSFSSHIDLNGYYLATSFIDADTTGVCAVKVGEMKGHRVSRSLEIVFVLFVLLLAVFAVESFKIIVLGKELSLRIKKQLLVLFVVSNLLPGFILLIIGSDYLQQYRNGLVRDAFNLCMAYLQSIDELYVNEQTVQQNRLEKAVAGLEKKLKKNKLNRRTINNFIKQQHPSPYGFYLVASSSGIVASQHLILKNEKVVETIVHNFSGNELHVNTMKAMHKLCSYALAVLNKQSVADKEATEIEFISDTLAQKAPMEIVGMFADKGGFSEWGVGAVKHPTSVNLFRIFDATFYDYILFYLWDTNKLEIEFIRRVFDNLQRNEYGFKIMAVNERFLRTFPEGILQNDKVRNFTLRLGERPVTRPESCQIDAVDYLMMGHSCIFLKNTSLLGLYPVEKIDRVVSAKRNLLMLLALVSLLISVALSLFVASGVLRPLSELEKGMGALKERNFAHRLPNLGNDEFGHLAAIFNDAIIDLEEMHVASIVHEKLVTPMTDVRCAGNLKIFARTVASSGGGGDYFELSETGSTRTSLLLCEVAGSGIGNSLMLAFLKSAAMQLKKLADKAKPFMEALNAMLIRSSREGQNKSVSAQYLVFLEDDGIELVTATVSTPLLFDFHSRSLKQIEFSYDTPLGVRAKTDIAANSIKLAKNQSLILYTGGLVMDEKAKAALITLSDPDPQIFCDRFIAAYFSGDTKNNSLKDLTLVIVTRA